MNFGFGQLVEVMSAMHDDVDAGIVEARLKYFQRLPFPSQDIKVGKGGRAYYSADQLMKLVAALELLAAGIVPLQAAGLVSENWGEVAKGLGRAWLSRHDAMAAQYLFASVDGFDTRRGRSGSVDIAPDPNAANWLRGAPAGRRQITIVDLVRVAGALNEAFHPENPHMDMLRMARDVGDWAELHAATRRTGS